MQCLVTGITGFLGPTLAKQLIANNHKVYGLLRGTRGSEQEIKDLLTEEEFDKITFLYGDLIHYRTMDKIFKENKFDKVFH